MPTNDASISAWTKLSSGPVVGSGAVPVVGTFLTSGLDEVDGFSVVDGVLDGAADALFDGDTEGDELFATSGDFLGVG
jgi:hypothetical protein